jgi:solute carrier family 25 carnitine/acylcarnitine transporter 20/29
MSPSSSWLDQRADVWTALDKRKTVVSATIGSLTSTFLGYPLDSIKARLQTIRGPVPSLPSLTASILREEGIRGLWRGCLVPLVSIAVVRACSVPGSQRPASSC